MIGWWCGRSWNEGIEGGFVSDLEISVYVAMKMGMRIRVKEYGSEWECEWD